jgi:HEAT repeat protein
MQVLTKFGEQAIDPLIRIIKESNDIRPLKLAAAVLRGIGEKGKKRFFEELNLGLTADEIRNFVVVLPDIGSTETVEQFSALLNYPDIEVKKEIMRFLSKINNNQSKILLIEQLKSRDAEVVNAVVLLLGDIKCSEALPALMKILESRSASPALQEDICIALGTIADGRAIDALIAKLIRKPGIFSKDKGALDRVRMRAAWALRKFAGPSVEYALESVIKDKSAPVALTAKESLAIIRQTRVGESTW